MAVHRSPVGATEKPWQQHATPIVMDKQAVIRRVRIAEPCFLCDGKCFEKELGLDLLSGVQWRQRPFALTDII